MATAIAVSKTLSFVPDPIVSCLLPASVKQQQAKWLATSRVEKSQTFQNFDKLPRKENGTAVSP